MVTKVFMPKAGMSMETGTVLKWLKAEGDRVEAGEALLEIETDKVSMEVEALSSGTLLKIIRQPGDVVPVTHTIAYLGDPGDSLEGLEEDVPEPSPEQEPARDGEDLYDVIVIGGGPAGYHAAIRAAQLGGRVLVFEGDSLGGTCLNRGCIPTKSYLESARVLRTIQKAGTFGVEVDASTARADLPKILSQKNRIVKQLTDGVGKLFQSHGIELVKAFASILPDGGVAAGGKTYRAKSILYAAGSLPAKPDIPGADLPRVVTSNELLELDQIPKRLLILGGGVIGVEFATAFAAFGSQVTVVELADRLLPGMEAQVGALLAREFKKAKIAALTGSTIEEIRQGEGGLAARVTGGKELEADCILLAVSRIPNLEGIRDAGVELQNGRVAVDDHMRTSIPHIYAPGDANGRLMLAHAAFHMATVAAENAMGGDSSYRPDHTPTCVYTHPEIASVGLTEEEAAGSCPVRTGTFPYSANGRALAARAAQGFAKVVAHGETGELLGVHLVGENATEIIGQAAVMLHMEMTAEEMESVVTAHPTCAETLAEACADVLGLSIHTPKK